MKRRSNNYVMTVDVGCAGDMADLGRLRDTIKVLNNIYKEKAYVKLHGRGSRVDHAVSDSRNRRAYDCELPLKYADRMDVYVYTK